MAPENQVLAEDTPIQRREERNPTNWIATIRLRDGTEIPCNVKDVSKSGARIGVPARQDLPEIFLLRIIGRDFLCQVRLAWRRGDYVGVRIERVGKVPPPAPPREIKASEPAPEPVPVETANPESGSVGLRSRRRSFSTF
ncbi:PilZ domain-containing protein [Methylobacterium iners]|uniref:PilZ domain-containing protein n=1 Tax=Methylobacterium iners TaxID=418707 RepID=A0ABQ4RW73_9HYPH|nr:PilZ domain-containing protein [Methylobacterium iners]GJD94630.1 hypothetical protein OCOJLMKI_1833 [Methylobacterium iners]